MQSVTLRSIARTSPGSTTMAISPARLRSDSSIRVRCGDGPCRLRAIPSGRALRCNLRLPAPETRVSIPEPPRASTPVANKHYSSRRDGPLSHTCSLRQPLRGPTLRSAPFRPWLARLRR